MFTTKRGRNCGLSVVARIQIFSATLKTEDEDLSPFELHVMMSTDAGFVGPDVQNPKTSSIQSCKVEQMHQSLRAFRQFLRGAEDHDLECSIKHHKQLRKSRL